MARLRTQVLGICVCVVSEAHGSRRPRWVDVTITVVNQNNFRLEFADICTISFERVSEQYHCRSPYLFDGDAGVAFAGEY